MMKNKRSLKKHRKKLILDGNTKFILQIKITLKEQIRLMISCLLTTTKTGKSSFIMRLAPKPKLMADHT